MITAIKSCGIVPFFKNSIRGWSIEEMTAKGYWFFDSDGSSSDNDGSSRDNDGSSRDNVLGPWDWKVDAVQTGEIAYGKFIGGKAAFATVEWYRELMNWRRNCPKYAPKGQLEPLILNAIRNAGSLGSKEIRLICNAYLGTAAADSTAIIQNGAAAGQNGKTTAQCATQPKMIKKAAVDALLRQLQMGTWSLIGDIERVYRGPQLEYKGWQRASNTTPEALFGIVTEAPPMPAAVHSAALDTYGQGIIMKGTPVVSGKASTSPSWARRLEEHAGKTAAKPLAPAESLENIISHVQQLFPDAQRRDIEKLLR